MNKYIKVYFLDFTYVVAMFEELQNLPISNYYYICL